MNHIICRGNRDSLGCIVSVRRVSACFRCYKIKKIKKYKASIHNFQTSSPSLPSQLSYGSSKYQDRKCFRSVSWPRVFIVLDAIDQLTACRTGDHWNAMERMVRDGGVDVITGDVSIIGLP
jgi:hypothetical protein